ncbi:uncharacterized protein SRS1_10916 [Sporisorium reilianum f. sp. reilianum]|uniref:Secreted protein n=1 Tax=Sporisorium reilianum f. sp. reilianum TaxID=72559 RepID=A0A2N8UN84_9BASI|nr:uncharacterized protein SRS1_10916 [Sporisorium reilianum f. sp. reilianum]
MHLLKTLPVFLLYSAAYASPRLHKRSRKDCVRDVTEKVHRDAKHHKPDVVVCYHGRNSATDTASTLTNKDSDHFGSMGYHTCDAIGLDCFWMKGANQWRGYEDAGDDNIHALRSVWMVGRGDKAHKVTPCTYDRNAVSIVCASKDSLP